jgi:hypothetical protein
MLHQLIGSTRGDTASCLVVSLLPPVLGVSAVVELAQVGRWWVQPHPQGQLGLQWQI